MLRISVIIPTLNEAETVVETIKCIRNASNVEIITVDGDSSDDTVDLARAYGARVFTAAPGRAGQMNTGAVAATGEILLFLHADTHLPEGFDNHVRRIVVQPETAAGAFLLRLDDTSPGMRLVERVTNWRSRSLHMPYGDQAIFLKADLFRDLHGFRDIPIMEDFELLLRLRRRGRIVLAPASVVTSARRWRKLGMGRTTIINQLAIMAYCLGMSPSSIAGWYRRRAHGILNHPPSSPHNA